MTRTFSFLTLATSVMGALLTGLVVGSVANQQPSGSERTERTPGAATTPETPTSPSKNGAAKPLQAAGDTKLIEQIRQQEEEIARLKEQIAKPKAGATAAAPAKDAKTVAQELLALAKDVSFGEGREGRRGGMNLLRRADEITADMAPYFIEAYANAKTEDEKRAILLMLMQAGGANVTQFLNSQLSSGNPPEMLLNAIGGFGGRMFGERKYPVDSTLAQTAYQLTRGTTTEQRRAGAALLGGATTTAYLPSLQQLATSDPEARVRMTAIRSLGESGDASTLAFLKALPKPTGDDRQTRWVSRSIDGAIETLEKKLTP